MPIKKTLAPLMIIITLSCSLTLAGCARDTGSNYGDGGIPFKLGHYKIEEQGLCALVSLLRQKTDMPRILTVGFFSADLNRKGLLESFNLSLHLYDDNYEYTGTYDFSYRNKDGNLFANRTDTYKISYNDNNEVNFLDTQIKRLPLIQQIALLDFPRYVLLYNGVSKLSSGDTLIDGTNGRSFPVLTINEYRSGEGGVSDGNWAVIIKLYSGINLISEQHVDYRCDPANVDQLHGNRDFHRQIDYYIDYGELRFTRDYGDTWIKTDITEEELEKTLKFYRNGFIIPEDSYSVTLQSDTIAFLYGDSPALRVSYDNGVTWTDQDFGIDSVNEHSFTKRIVRFFDHDAGYVGLGTDWRMGTGVIKFGLVTRNGGKTWEQFSFPESERSSSTLSGLSFCSAEMTNGVASLMSIQSDVMYPNLFFTDSGGKDWTECFFAWDQLPDEISFLQKVDSLTFNNGCYNLLLAAGDRKVSFQSHSLFGEWTYVTNWQEVGHCNG